MTSRTLFVAALLLAVVAACPLAGAQQVPPPKIGFLTPPTSDGAAVLIEAFRRGLRDVGRVEGKTFILEARYAEGRAERLPELARELVSLKPAVIVTTADAATAAVKRETRTIPIVMSSSIDPVGTGLVTSLARPGGNVTGISSLSSELGGKRLELLKEGVPGLARVAVLWNPDVRGSIFEYKETEAAAHALRLELQSLEVSTPADLDRAFSAVTSQRAQALILAGQNPVTFSKQAEIASFAQKNRLPSMYPSQAYVDAGGLMFYGPSIPSMYHRVAVYVDKILKGAKPAELPVEQPTKFELVINLKTANTLGLAIQQSLIRRADRVIQ